MTTKLSRSPLQTGRTYRDRLGRRWSITKVTNAGRDGYGAALPALALASCIDSAAALDADTRFPQWVEAATGRWSPAYATNLDLIEAA